MNTFPITTKLAGTTKDKNLQRELIYLLRVSQGAIAQIQEIMKKWLVKTQTVIAGVKPHKRATVKSLIRNFVTTGKAQGFTYIDIAEEVLNASKVEKVCQAVPGPARLIRFKDDVYDDQVTDQLKRIGCYKSYDFSDAIQRATLLVAAGAFRRKKGCDIYIYLTGSSEAPLYYLSVWGQGTELNLRLFQASADSTSSAGDGLLVDNELFAS